MSGTGNSQPFDFFHMYPPTPNYSTMFDRVQALTAKRMLSSYAFWLDSIALSEEQKESNRIDAFLSLGHLTNFSKEANQQTARQALSCAEMFIHTGKNAEEPQSKKLKTAAMICLSEVAQTTPKLRQPAITAFATLLASSYQPDTPQANQMIGMLLRRELTERAIAKHFHAAGELTGQPFAVFAHGYLRERIQNYNLAVDPPDVCFTLAMCEKDSFSRNPLLRREAQKTLGFFLRQTMGNELMKDWQGLRDYEKTSKDNNRGLSVSLIYPAIKAGDLLCRFYHAGILPTIERGLQDSAPGVRAEALEAFKAADTWPQLHPSHALLASLNAARKNPARKIRLTPPSPPSWTSRLRLRIMGL